MLWIAWFTLQPWGEAGADHRAAHLAGQVIASLGTVDRVDVKALLPWTASLPSPEPDWEALRVNLENRMRLSGALRDQGPTSE